MSMCAYSGTGVYDDGTLPTTTQFAAQCTCGAFTMVENGRIAEHVAGNTAPWDDPAGCFGHCDPEGWFSPCRVKVTQSSERMPGVSE